MAYGLYEERKAPEAATVDANGRPIPAPAFDPWKYADPNTVKQGAPPWATDFLGGSLNNYWGVRAPDGPGKQQMAGQMFLPENKNYQLSYANGQHMMFPSLGPASSGFFQNMGAQVPAQANAKDWYAKVDTAMPNWWDKGSGSTTFEYHPQSKDNGFGTFLTSALGMGVSALLGLPPSPGSVILGGMGDSGGGGGGGVNLPLQATQGGLLGAGTQSSGLL